MNLTQIAKHAGGEMRCLVASYFWRPVDNNGNTHDIEIRIDVYQYPDPDGYYLAIPSHKVKTPHQASDYASIQPKQSAEEAVKDCTDGFKMFMGDPDETQWLPND